MANLLINVHSIATTEICYKKLNCQFKLKLGTQANSDMQNSMVVLTFSVSNWKFPSWENLVKTNQNCQFKLKFCTYNSGQNIVKLYNIFVQIPFTTSKRKLDIQYIKLGIRVAL